MAESRIAAMMNQMQPRFMYNILVVIQEMCENDAENAISPGPNIFSKCCREACRWAAPQNTLWPRAAARSVTI